MPYRASWDALSGCCLALSGWRPQTRSRDLAAHFARGLLSNFLTPHSEGAGNAGRRSTRSRACSVGNMRVSHHEYAGNTRHSPRNGFNGFLRALPGDRACLPPSSAVARQLDTSVGASGPHDFAVRSSLARQARIRVHRIPPRACDVASRPSEWDETESRYSCFYRAVKRKFGNSEIDTFLQGTHGLSTY
jgi:hypothetical protein